LNDVEVTGQVGRRRHRGEREAASGCLDAGERAQSGAQSPDLDAEPGPVRPVDGARLENALDEAIAGDVGRPGGYRVELAKAALAVNYGYRSLL